MTVHHIIPFYELASHATLGYLINYGSMFSCGLSDKNVPALYLTGPKQNFSVHGVVAVLASCGRTLHCTSTWLNVAFHCASRIRMRLHPANRQRCMIRSPFHHIVVIEPSLRFGERCCVRDMLHNPFHCLNELVRLRPRIIDRTSIMTSQHVLVPRSHLVPRAINNSDRLATQA